MRFLLLTLVSAAATILATLFFTLSAIAQSENSASQATTVFAGGCFWCVEADFEKLDGVVEAVSGYTGGSSQNPTYRNHDDHIEAAEIRYDPSVIGYRELVRYFLRHIDPLDDGGQFCDRGHSYTTAIFVANNEERRIAEEEVAIAEEVLGETVVTPVVDASQFWLAEEYHQDYYKKNPRRYAYYRSGCGRDRRIKMVWGDNK